MNSPYYFDYAATTPCSQGVISAMSSALGMDACFANAGSRSHALGWQAEQLVEKARKQAADLLDARVTQIYWVSGATEANNLSILGTAKRYREKVPTGGHIVTSALEHKAVLGPMEHLAASEGFEVTYLSPNDQGLITKEQVRSALRDDTFLVSLMMVNNELGTITDIQAIGEILSPLDLVFHVDGAQGLGKLPCSMQTLSCDLFSASAHKLYGPKGVGLLYVRAKDIQPLPLVFGGGQEKGLRPGTLPVHQIVGFGQACEEALQEQTTRCEQAAEVNKAFRQRLSTIDGCTVNSPSLPHSVPHIMNIRVAGVDGETLMAAMPSLAISSGSACASTHVAPSHVLKGIGLSHQAADESVRFSFGVGLERKHYEHAINLLEDVAYKLRK